ncbi:MAG: YARHG domain-containing protein, partial [Eubacteriales bacterium]|nr:YARHG domain-containing protein [Eubacteriales bacterium]
STSGGSAGNGSGSTSGGSTGSGSGSTAASWTVTPSSGTMYATWDVNVRSGASKDNSRLGGLSNGEAVTVTGYTDNGWIQVSYNGQTGYVAGNYLSWDRPTVSTGSSGSSNSGAWDDSYIMSDINSRYVSESELNGWSSENLAILRNEIFARHGRIFTTQKWSNYFAQKTWYVPTYDPSYFDSNMSSFLNEYERANLDVILKVEAQ